MSERMEKPTEKNSLFPPKLHGERLNRIALILSHSLRGAVTAMSYEQVTFFSRFPFNGVSKGKQANQKKKMLVRKKLWNK